MTDRVEPIGLQTLEDQEAMEALDSAVVISMEVAQLEGLAGDPMEALEVPVLGSQGLEVVARFPVSNAGLCRSNPAKTCLDSSAVACLASNAGVSLNSSAASSVSQSGGARFATSWKGQEGLARLAKRPFFYTG